jgi:hypothetical protein
MSDPIGRASGLQTQGLTPEQAKMDPYLLLETLASERSEALRGTTASQSAEIQRKNEQIRNLNKLYEAVNAADPQPPDTSQLKAIGEQMENWESVGGQSWMNPEFKDTLDKFGIETKASGMTKAQMYSGTGWTVSYPTDEYHDLGRQVVAKADRIASGNDPDFPPKLDLNGTIPDSAPPQTYKQALDAAGISYPSTPDGRITVDQLDTIKENIKTGIDSVSSDSQLDLIKLQGLINKQSEAEQLASGAENKRDQTSTSVIQKIT